MERQEVLGFTSFIPAPILTPFHRALIHHHDIATSKYCSHCGGVIVNVVTASSLPTSWYHCHPGAFADAVLLDLHPGRFADARRRHFHCLLESPPLFILLSRHPFSSAISSIIPPLTTYITAPSSLQTQAIIVSATSRRLPIVAPAVSHACKKIYPHQRYPTLRSVAILWDTDLEDFE